MDQEVGGGDQLRDPVGDRPGIPGVDDAPPGPGRAHHVRGADREIPAILLDADRLPALDPAKERPGGDPECDRPLPVEPPGPGVLCKDVPEALHPVIGGKCPDRVAIEPDRGAMRQLDRGERELEAEPGEGPDSGDRLVHPCRAVNRERIGPPHEGEGLYEPRDPEEVIGMPVGHEDGIHEKPGTGPHHLLLGPLPAVEEEGV